MAKKGKVTASKKSNIVPLFSNTTCNKDEWTTTWEAMYNLLEEEQPRPLVAKATIDAQESSNASYFKTVCYYYTE